MWWVKLPQAFGIVALRKYIAETLDERVQRADANSIPPALLVDMLNARTRKARFGNSYMPTFDTWFIEKRTKPVTFTRVQGPAKQKGQQLHRQARPQGILGVANGGSAETR